MTATAAVGNSLRDFFDIMTYRYPSSQPPRPPIKPKPEYTITFTKYPYNHTSFSSKKYEYNINSEFEVYSISPYELDLIHDIYMCEKIKHFSTKRIYAHDQDQYKQIVIHHKTFTGVFNIAHGVQEKVMEVRMN